MLINLLTSQRCSSDGSGSGETSGEKPEASGEEVSSISNIIITIIISIGDIVLVLIKGIKAENKQTNHTITAIQ